MWPGGEDWGELVLEKQQMTIESWILPKSHRHPWKAFSRGGE
jgi:hypothetical protein